MVIQYYEICHYYYPTSGYLCYNYASRQKGSQHALSIHRLHGTRVYARTVFTPAHLETYL